MKKAVIYINQFFGQIGGEDKADFQPIVNEGTVGPAIELNKNLDAEVTHTIICGDNFMGSNTEEAIKIIISQLKNIEFDIFFAGPAFQAGRYGVACGEICKAVKEAFNVPVITSMHIENPGVEMFKKDMYVFVGGHSAAKMRSDIKSMTIFGNKLLKGEEIYGAEVEGYYPRGMRHQIWRKDGKVGADRAVEMLVEKLNGRPFITELSIPKTDIVPVAQPIEELKDATIALLNTGGIVPIDNPDRIQSASATRWGRYNIIGVDDLKGGVYKTIHAGFDPAAADENPNVIAPIDALRAYEKEGKFKKLHEYFYSTVGTGTTQAEAKRMAQEILVYLNNEGVDGVIMVST